MQLTRKFDKKFRFLLCATEINKYALVTPLKDKICIAVTNDLEKKIRWIKPQANEIWVDIGTVFGNTLMKSWLYKSDTEIYSTHNEEKSVAVEFIRTSKNKFTNSWL